jgi:hypothetical protein
MGRYTDAEPLLTGSYEALRTTHGPDDDRVKAAKARLEALSARTE